MKNEIDVIRDLAAKFGQERIPYMLTGSMAMNYYAQPRMTRDIDLVIALGPGDVNRIFHLFDGEYYVAREAVANSIQHESLFNLIHHETVIKIDCIPRKRSEYRLLEFERRREIAIANFTVFIVSREDLIISKLEWARDSRSQIQLRDVKNLMMANYDVAYLEHWVRRLDLFNLWRECADD